MSGPTWWEQERADAARFMEPDLIDPAKRYNAKRRALDLAGPLGIHEQSAAFLFLERELRIIERLDELTIGRMHVGPTTLGKIRAQIESAR